MLIGDGYAIKGNLEEVKRDKKVLKFDRDEFKGNGGGRDSATRDVTLRWFDGATLKRDREVLKGKREASHGDKEEFKGN